LCKYGLGGVALDHAQAVALYRLAAAQNLDDAQYGLGFMYYYGYSVVKDHAEALRLYQLAATQGHPEALKWVAHCHERGYGVPKNKAIHWYRRAQAAGYHSAADALQRLVAE
jgi:TPR repeat protein